MKKAELMTKANGMLSVMNRKMGQKNLDIGKMGGYIGNNVVGVNIWTKIPTARTQLPRVIQKQNKEGVLVHGDAFYEERVSKANISFIPKEYLNEAFNIGLAIRRRKTEFSVAGDYIPAASFDGFKKEFDAAREKFFAVRDKIAAGWDEAKTLYEEGVREVLENIQMDQARKDQIVIGLMNEIPEKEEYLEGFEMEMRIFYFPTEPDKRPGLAPNVTEPVLETWNTSVAATAVLAIEQSIGKGWERLNTAMKQFRRNGAIRTNTLSTIVNYGRDLQQKNLFHNELLSHLQNKLTGFLDMKGDQQVEEIEASIVRIYEYAKAHRIDLDMDDSAYLAGELDAMARKKAPVAIKVTITRKKAPEANTEINPRSRYARHIEMRKARQRIRQTAMQENAG